MEVHVISWKKHANYNCNYPSADKTKHNSIWSKALSMPLTIWNCVWSYICHMVANGLLHCHRYLPLDMLVLLQPFVPGSKYMPPAKKK